ncbi:MAG: polysaccharide biosynthesis/export family protein [Paludibacteraceae bacterium]|nr:polysaccharide biosynthesis/export family protein [Paludibacteraceae bacterium]MBO5014019.1 polysaccharide biosynthesis/export family protein [Paludibacteraceae bacterium]
MSFKRIWIILLPLLMASCVTSKRVNLMQEPGKNGIPQYADTMSYEDYELRIGDRLYIYVYSVDERVDKMFNSSSGTIGIQMLQGSGGVGGSYDLYTYLVQEDGCIDFPMVGRVPVRGMTTRGVKRVLEDELSSFIKSYGDYQMMSVEVKIVRRSFSVISDRGSGTFNIQKEKVTIFEALAMAGDIGDFGDRSKVRIVREKEGQTQVKEFDVRSEDIINSEFYYIEPNDVIYIQRIKGQSFGINSVTTSISVVATTLAFGGFVYGLVVRTINAVENANAK